MKLYYCRYILISLAIIFASPIFYWAFMTIFFNNQFPSDRAFTAAMTAIIIGFLSTFPGFDKY